MNCYVELNKIVSKYKDSPKESAAVQATAAVFVEYLSQLDRQLRKRAESTKENNQ